MNGEIVILAYVECASEFGGKGKVYSPSHCSPTVLEHWHKDAREGLILID